MRAHLKEERLGKLFVNFIHNVAIFDSPQAPFPQTIKKVCKTSGKNHFRSLIMYNVELPYSV